MKTIKLLSILFISSLVFISCSDDDDPIPVNEEEVITTMTATLTPTGGGTAIVLKTQDLDGDGPNAPVITVSNSLAINTVYTGVMEVLNETESPAEGIQFTLTTTDVGSGTITISLVHEPEKTEPGVSSGDITNAEGETDIDATFSIVVQ